MVSSWHLRLAVHCVCSGGVIAYPTEAVYGLGCDPLNPRAVQRLFRLKGRAADKGLILIGAEPRHLIPYMSGLPPERAREVWDSWPGHLTWIVPAHTHTPDWLTGGRNSIALRLTAHPLAAALCRACGGALVSTSLNRSGRPPARTALQARLRLPDGCDYLLHGRTGPYNKPSTIRDAYTGTILRRGGD